MKIIIASDHAGCDLKKLLLEELKTFEVLDLGPSDSSSSVDYPDYAKKLCNEILSTKEAKGILICGTGIGMSITANRFSGIRAALCSDTYSAKMSRMHNDANVLCLGSRVIGVGLALEILKTWLNTAYEGGRHQKRIDKMSELKTT